MKTFTKEVSLTKHEIYTINGSNLVLVGTKEKNESGEWDLTLIDAPSVTDQPIIDDVGDKRWYNSKGKRHRDGDLPAVIWDDGSQFWYKDGQSHRDGDKPAVVYIDGTKEWWVDGKKVVVDNDGTKRWCNSKGQLHRDGEGLEQLPAVVYVDGGKIWYKNGAIHRDGDLPAVECADGGKFWYKNGAIHRGGGRPAIIRAHGAKEWWVEGKKVPEPVQEEELHTLDSDGNKFWYKNGKRHRDGDLPAVEYADGGKFWYKNGKRHRDGDFPASTYASGSEFWFKNGKRHRDGDKPAIIRADGTKEWWIDGKQVSAPVDETVEQILNIALDKISAMASKQVIHVTKNGTSIVMFKDE